MQYFLAAGQFVGFWASGGANFNFPKMGDSMPTPMNHRAKFDASIALSSP